MDTLGGGERYLLSIAACFKDQEVTLYWNDKNILKKAQDKFRLDLDTVTVSTNIFTPHSSVVTRLVETKRFDYFFYVSDGSIPLIGSKRVFPIIQFPIDGVNAHTALSRMKLMNTSKILCYSNFVKKFLTPLYPVPVTVLYPAVSQITVSTKKENIILSVGRFTKGNNTKNQEMLITFFKEHSKDFDGWKLILAGSFLPDDEDYVKQLKKFADGGNIDFHTNISFSELSQLYSRSKIYWHAAGYGQDVQKNPQRAEHFGISVVEAMSAGNVPIVFNGGGLTEIVEDGTSGFLFTSRNELLDETKHLIHDSKVYEQMSQKAKLRSEDFSVSTFNKKLQEIVK